MSADQFGSPCIFVIFECHATWFFGQLNVAFQGPKIASSMRSFREHQRFHVAKVIFFHLLPTISSKIQRLTYKYDSTTQTCQGVPKKWTTNWLCQNLTEFQQFFHCHNYFTYLRRNRHWTDLNKKLHGCVNHVSMIFLGLMFYNCRIFSFCHITHYHSLFGNGS